MNVTGKRINAEESKHRGRGTYPRPLCVLLPVLPLDHAIPRIGGGVALPIQAHAGQHPQTGGRRALLLAGQMLMRFLRCDKF